LKYGGELELIGVDSHTGHVVRCYLSL